MKEKDADGDGRWDLAVIHQEGGGTRVRWLLGTASGVFTPQSGPIVPAPAVLRDLAAVDADLDGDFDLATLDITTGATLAVLAASATVIGPGGQTITLPLSAPLPALATGDIDGDSDIDLVATGRAGPVLEIAPRSPVLCGLPTSAGPSAFVLAISGLPLARNPADLSG